tara:strand:+ start:547 stop:786 length:240 start_codon:yes stop_codon:yes gene_type:complete
MAKGYSKKKKKETKGKTGGRPAILDLVDNALGVDSGGGEAGEAQYGAGAISTAVSTSSIGPRRAKRPVKPTPSRPGRRP